MNPNREFRSRLPLPKSVLWSTMIDPRRTATSSSMFGGADTRTTNTRMSSTCVKPTVRTQTQTSTAVRATARLGSHPYMSATVRPTLRIGSDLSVGTKQVVTRLDFDSDNRSASLSSSDVTNASTNLIDLSAVANTPLKNRVKSPKNVANSSPAKSPAVVSVLSPIFNLSKSPQNITSLFSSSKTSISSSALSPPKIKSPTIDWNAITQEAEVVKLKTKISQLEGLLEESKSKSSQKSVEYELKIEGLKNDVERERNKCSEVENNMKGMEQKFDDLCLQLNNAREEFAKEYDKYEKRINELNRTIVEVRNQLSDSRSASESIEARHQSETVAFEHEIQTLRNQVIQCHEEQQVFQNQIQILRTEAEGKEELENQLTGVKAEVILLSEELQSYKDGIKLSSILENELKELKELREQNRELQQSNDILSDVHSKNLILEEKIISLESQLKAATEQIKQTVVTDIEATELRRRLEEWEQTLVSDSPSRVSAHISQLQTTELMLRSELGGLKSEFNELESKKNRLETEFNSNKNKIEEQNNLIKKLNRKCLLFAKEKDSYKRLITSYEQDLTLDLNKVNADRVTELETIVDEYRSLVEELETETKQLRTEHKVEEYKKQISELEEELRRYKGLSAQLESIENTTREQSSENGVFRVIHLRQNPVSDELENQRNELRRISEENQRLSAKLELLENGCDADVTRQLDEGIKNRVEVEKLQQKLISAEKRQKNIIDAFKRTSKEFREVCWRLLGFRIDMLKETNTYRLSNVYSDSPEDCLMFQLESNQTIKLLENQYSRGLSDSVSTYLTQHDSYPAFLASLTLDLFRKQTMFSME